LEYFPAFIKLDKQNILIVGGGNIASNKLEQLLSFTNNIKIISPAINTKMKTLIQNNNLDFEKRFYEKNDLQNMNIVVVAIDDISLQKDIYLQSKQHNCLCNCVDNTDYCDFIFPSIIKKDNITIAISTGGISPAFSKYFKKYLENLIPNNIEEFLNKMKNYRNTMPKGKQRMEFLTNKVKKYFKDIGEKIDEI